MNKQAIKIELRVVIPALCLFAYKNRLSFNVSEITKGEFYTLLRRHAKHNLFKPSGAGINMKNIECLVIDGVIESLELNRSQYGGNYSNAKIDLYNECIDELNFDFKQLCFEAQMKSIVSTVNNHNLKFSKHVRS